MSKKRIANRIKVKPFVKYVNVNHIIPTRYNIQTELSVEQIIAKLDGLTTSAPAPKEGKDGKVEEQRDVLANQDARDLQKAPEDPLRGKIPRPRSQRYPDQEHETQILLQEAPFLIKVFNCAAGNKYITYYKSIRVYTVLSSPYINNRIIN